MEINYFALVFMYTCVCVCVCFEIKKKYTDDDVNRKDVLIEYHLKMKYFSFDR